MNIEVRDALPDLAHGRLSRPEIVVLSEHIQSCAGCRAELALLREVRRSQPLAPAIDISRITSAIPPYGRVALAAGPTKRVELKRPLGYAILAAAALIAVVVGGRTLTAPSGVRGMNAGNPPTAPVITIVGAPAPASAEAPAVRAPEVAIARAPVVKKRDVPSLSLIAGTQDLSDAELESLLSELDAIEAVPSAEPQSVTHSIENIGDGT
ncbi:MAG TPA: zf-HC2 domain-containing protein [Gemmatimonadaceae bacterium]|nr:zf-HC2 domain-containing protein [Gemmatimonadaceae bacterium]